MGLSERLARYAATRPRPLVVPVPGGTRTRLMAEAELRRRGWTPADMPMAAGLLIVCGDPGTALAEAVEAVWADLPGPRIRVRLAARTSEDAVRAAMDQAVTGLADLTAQRDDAASRIAAGPWQPGGDSGDGGDGGDGSDDGHSDHDEHDGHDEHGSHDEQGGHDEHGSHGRHGEHAHGGGHEHHMMGAPAGLAMADRAPDRDGLKLDVLHVPLGPVLPDWPAGLQVRVTLQGDVVQAAEVEVMGGTGGAGFWDGPWLAAAAGEQVIRGDAERRRAASHLDGLARFLGVAGWRDQAERARRLRDDVLAGLPEGEIVPGFARFARRTARSRTLRWMMRGVGVIDAAAVERYGLTGPAARHPGDAAARLDGLLAEIGESLAGLGDRTALDGDEGPRGPVGRAPSTALLAALPALLEGTELSSARLIVAGLDPDLEQIDPGRIGPGQSGTVHA
ncbi:hypothetical protein [Actinomadura sp. 9N407]|uniref:hypothetical protein n=1 Tax=Actinomadura sp. 9N407 TaxID=3375154 RepID=UPI00378B1342